MTTLDLTPDMNKTIVEAITVVQLAITGLLLLIATSPLIAIIYVLYLDLNLNMSTTEGGIGGGYV
jgi:heme/copper-type cytochrome/quinol oxidase subunit 1